MIILISLVLLTAACVYALMRGSCDAELVGIVGTFLFGSTLFVALLMLGTNRADCINNMIKIEARRLVQEQGRENGYPLEGAAWRAEVSEANEWLAKTKYWNRTLFDIWIPDSVESVEPIKP